MTRERARCGKQASYTLTLQGECSELRTSFNLNIVLLMPEPEPSKKFYGDQLQLMAFDIVIGADGDLGRRTGTRPPEPSPQVRTLFQATIVTCSSKPTG